MWTYLRDEKRNWILKDKGGKALLYKASTVVPRFSETSGDSGQQHNYLKFEQPKTN